MITPAQLKKTNLIFLEHQKFSKEIPLLKTQISSLERLNENLKITDSIRVSQLDRCMKQVQINNDALLHLDKSLRDAEEKNHRLRKWTIGGISVSVGLCIILLLK